MSAKAMQEADECIAFYDKRGNDWSSAVEFILAKHSGMLETILNRGEYIMIPRSRRSRQTVLGERQR